jgi:hypothetical protein
MARSTIRVGQRLVRWDGAKGYVDQNTKGTAVYGPGEEFQVCWLDADGSVEDADTLTLAALVAEGITRGRGLMRWAR